MRFRSTTPCSFQRLAGLVLLLLLNLGLRAQGPAEVVEAVVVYGDEKLIPEEEALTDERLDCLLDSLCTLDPAPEDMIRDLRLYQRIRRMDEEQMVMLIDSLFDLDTVPYALINEINLYSAQMPTQGEVDRGGLLAWLDDPTHDISGLYADWNTLAVHATTPASAARIRIDSSAMLSATNSCSPSPPALRYRY